jgi:hypothetical protein
MHLQLIFYILYLNLIFFLVWNRYPVWNSGNRQKYQVKNRKKNQVQHNFISWDKQAALFEYNKGECYFKIIGIWIESYLQKTSDFAKISNYQFEKLIPYFRE